jgi:carboxypeptidase C (cathepsin A)
MFNPAFLLIAYLLAFVQSQFLAPPTNLTTTNGFLDTPVRYKKVPNGICETTSGVNSYSGYVDVDNHKHVFWWFFEARNEDPTTAPLTVWLSGGPGASSLLGALIENGPCLLDENGDPHYNPYSWSYAIRRQIEALKLTGG